MFRLIDRQDDCPSCALPGLELLMGDKGFEVECAMCGWNSESRSRPVAPEAHGAGRLEDAVARHIAKKRGPLAAVLRVFF